MADELEKELARLKAERRSRLIAAKAAGEVPNTRNAWGSPRVVSQRTQQASASKQARAESARAVAAALTSMDDAPPAKVIVTPRNAAGTAAPPTSSAPTATPRSQMISARAQSVNADSIAAASATKPPPAATPAVPEGTNTVQTPRQTPRAKDIKPDDSKPKSSAKQLAEDMLNNMGALPNIPPAGTKFGHGEDGSYSVILPTNTPNPSDSEIEDYAKWLGLEAGEKELYWIAKAALTTPLPPNWRACETNGGDVYYFNFSTGESLWEHPLDDAFKQLVPVERDMKGTCEAEGCKYDVNDFYVHRSVSALLIGFQSTELRKAGVQGIGVRSTADDEVIDDVDDKQGGTTNTADDGTVYYIPDCGTVFKYDDGGHSMVLENNVGDYKPTDDEVTKYAEWLGIKDTETQLMWIAEEGLKAPLPDPWRPCKTDSGDVYYFNFSNGESLWEHPLDEHYKQLVIKERAKL